MVGWKEGAEVSLGKCTVVTGLLLSPQKLSSLELREEGFWGGVYSEDFSSVVRPLPSVPPFPDGIT